MKKIGILAFSEKEDGGIYQYTESMIDAFMLDKHNQYVVFTNKDNQDYDYLGSNLIKLDRYHEPVLLKILRFLIILLGLRLSFFIPSKIKKLFQDIDFFVSPVITPYPHFFMRKPYMFTLHDMQEKHLPDFFSLKERIRRHIINKRCARHASAILCESAFIKQDIIKFLKYPESNIHVITAPPTKNFLNLSYTDQQLQKIKKKYQLPDQYLFYPAQFWQHKNHINLLAALSIIKKEINSICLVLTGKKQFKYPEIIQKISELELDQNVIHVSYVPFSDLPALYILSSIMVMPTLYESVSIPIYEAFSLKTAVCCSDILALPDQIGEAGCRFDPYNPQDMADKILFLLKHPDQLKKYNIAGYNKYKDFDHGKYKEKLQAVLNKILISDK